jgi:membrane protein YdbS with pleckstrin-like domain
MSYNKENLGDGERIVHIAHKHVIVLLSAAAKWIALFLFAIIVALFLATQNWTGVGGTVRTILLLVLLLAAVGSFISFAIAYLVWQNEQYIITNERVIQTQGIINKKEFATSLDKVNDIQTSQTVMGRMFGYGTVELLTGSDSGTNVLTYLEKPLEFKKIMLNAKNRHYGDASDHTPVGAVGGNAVRVQVGDDDGTGRAYDAFPQPQGQGAYQNDPRGYAPPRPQPQPYQPPMQPNYPPQQPQPTAQQIADSIQQLARLRDSGIISEQEFQAKKNELMNRL